MIILSIPSRVAASLVRADPMLLSPEDIGQYLACCQSSVNAKWTSERNVLHPAYARPVCFFMYYSLYMLGQSVSCLP